MSVTEEFDNTLNTTDLPDSEAVVEKPAEAPAEEEAVVTTEEPVTAATDAADDITAEPEDTTDTPDEEVDPDTAAESADMPQQKKKPLFQVPVIIAACIVIGALLGYFIYTGFFLHQPEGLWKLEADGYTEFYSFAEDGSCMLTTGTVDMAGSFTKSSVDGVNTISVNQYYGHLAGEFTYTVTGSRLLGNQILHVSADELSYDLVQIRKVDEYLTPYPDFVENKELTGEWEYFFEDYGLSYVFVFNADGTMQINQYDTYYYNGIYTYDDENVHFTYYTNENQETDLPYSIDGDVLTFMGLECHRVGTSTADET